MCVLITLDYIFQCKKHFLKTIYIYIYKDASAELKSTI